MTTTLLTLPLWMQFLAGFVLLGLGLMFILMPFSVFGVKPRLEEVELQLNEVRAELRIIAMRLAQGGAETGPSGEPVFTPPRRSAGTRDGDAKEVPVQHGGAAHSPSSAEAMPWSSEAARAASHRPAVYREPPAAGERRERPAPVPPARDDYSYAESGAQETVEKILRPTHFDPPPQREAPRPPRMAPGTENGATERMQGYQAYTSTGPASSYQRAERSAPEPAAQTDRDAAWRLKVQRQEMAPRATQTDAERLRQAEDQRRVRSEPTLRWPPRP
ncbi:hypothetical protein [Swaminathania salitolerans]|uniref:Uncharacterized protein n=1 Tax=Swaminathania salitolerans TaxID=182838 RepID=A0A511BPG5_9PROT|nr:hypothetical protein [Swaminathania salitolerans]GBQ10913.1 hypothetical protein AA21291_0621 [Swaminathania salitolerans LMG 21291]GEL02229.1 hypothetical protein SSA02_13920 [Swaminathania salitolerans]